MPSALGWQHHLSRACLGGRHHAWLSSYPAREMPASSPGRPVAEGILGRVLGAQAWGGPFPPAGGCGLWSCSSWWVPLSPFAAPTCRNEALLPPPLLQERPAGLPTECLGERPAGRQVAPSPLAQGARSPQGEPAGRTGQVETQPGGSPSMWRSGGGEQREGLQQQEAGSEWAVKASP